MTRHRIIRFLSIIFLICLILYIFLISKNEIKSFLLLSKIKSSFENKILINSFQCPIQGEKWIIITTIFYPTIAIYKFLNLTTNWNLIVIADKKTPKDWLQHLHINFSSRLIFLSYKQQQQKNYLNFRILNYLPSGSYARKNLGYLIAIKCGGKLIFESDDDNLIETNDIFYLPKNLQPKQLPWIAFHRQRSLFINIYASFGHPQIWPRGFPLDQLKNLTEDGWHSVRKNEQINTNVYIQQYLADLDPDVDAIYRLAHPFSIGQIHFDRDQSPIVLDRFTFSPYNTQNTITYYEAFWGLYLPITTTFRVCDIWRSYWVQRLLWDIDGQLMFGTSTIKQIRNSHSYLKDMEDEYQLYHQSSLFVQFLSSWSSSYDLLEQRILQLAKDIAKAGFWQWKEVEIIDAWLSDLHSVGYSFPSIIQQSISKSLTKKRAAICVTGLTECIHEGWGTTSNLIHNRLQGDIDIFLFLSSSMKKGPIPLSTRLKQIRSYMNSTVTIIYEDRIIDPGIPSDCNPQFQLPRHITFPVQTYFQQLWALNQCYDFVREYEKHFNIEYQLFIRTRIDIRPKMPLTFERSGLLNINTTIIIPPHRYFSGIDDGFALGPIELMSYYMKRWISFQQCPSDRNFHPETYLRNYLKHFTNITIDSSISGAADAIPHGPRQCH